MGILTAIVVAGACIFLIAFMSQFLDYATHLLLEASRESAQYLLLVPVQ